jgi:hypothetical protein
LRALTSGVVVLFLRPELVVLECRNEDDS